MKRLFALALSLALVATMFTACGGGDDTASETKEIRVGMSYEPETLDPANASGDTAKEAIDLLGEPLLRNVDGAAEPGVAESYEVSKDGKTYTFHLRESKFADGTAITAKDFVYTILRALNPENGLTNSYLLYDIVGAEAYNLGEAEADEVGVKAIDDQTLEITTMSNSFPLTYTDTVYVPISEAKVSEAGESYGSESDMILTNGPFVATGWTHESELILEKNQEYWNKDAIKLDKIIYKINAADETGADMMKAGELDFCEFRDKKLVDSIMDGGEFNLESAANGFEFLYINHKGKSKETEKWMGNADFRRALSLALDREALVKAVYTSDAVATRLTMPTSLGEEKTIHEEYPYEGYPATAQPEEAKTYLEKAMKTLGAKDVSEIPELTILCNDNNANMNCLNAISDMWEKNLGVRSIIDAQPLNSMLDKADAGDFDFWKGGQAAGIVDWVTETGGDFLSTKGAPMFYANDEYDRLFRNVADAKTWKARKDAQFELEKHYCENTLSIHITWIQGQVIFRNNITDVKYRSDGEYDLTYADVK